MANYAGATDDAAREAVQFAIGQTITATSTLINTTQLVGLLGLCDGIINDFLGITTNATDSLTAQAAKNVEIELAAQAIMIHRKFRETNLVDDGGVGTVATFMPRLTTEHQQRLIKARSRDQGLTTRTFDARTGEEIIL